ncbi:MAG: hypothetical protein RBT71_11505, partial [Flavobacteriales bacterium]|nr:hypothetical protein [Flavobacteriales bacterium]
MELHFARYRLLFHHPFGTAHGTRDGTDAVFVRWGRNGIYGHGEATLPPYLPHTADEVVGILRQVAIHRLEAECEMVLRGATKAPAWTTDMAARNALISAYIELRSNEMGVAIASWMEVPEKPFATAMVTLGHGAPELIAAKLGELPRSRVLKVKLGSGLDRRTMEQVLALDDRRLFLDAIQGGTEGRLALD